MYASSEQREADILRSYLANAYDPAVLVANYAGNVEKAKDFTERTGITAYRWDVGDHEACIHNCVEIEAVFGQIDVLVNNAGVTRDGTLHKMSFDDWNEVMRINLGGAQASFGQVSRPVPKRDLRGLRNCSSRCSGVAFYLFLGELLC